MELNLHFDDSALQVIFSPLFKNTFQLSVNITLCNKKTKVIGSYIKMQRKLTKK